RQSVAIPLLMRWPGRVAEGEKDERIVANIDIAPTILDAIGIEPSSEFPMDGRSLLSDGARDRILLEQYENNVHLLPDWASVFGGSFQYTEYYKTRGGELKYVEYYDLESDPFELENLLGDETQGNDPDVVSLSDDLNSIRSCRGADCP
ncbi:MAG: sulfatase/phosphatase domain-containing protein, partial [Actinomycetota bacterium]